MKSIVQRTKRASLALILSLFVPQIACSQEHEALVNPKDYVSPSHEYVLDVDPSDPYGRGEATYRVTRKGKEVWSGKKPFTLHDARITDTGIFAGFAYTHGVSGGYMDQGREGQGEFRVVIMRPNGDALLDEVTVRSPSRFVHFPPNPRAVGLLVDAAGDTLFIRIHDPDVNRRSDSWWKYEVSSGKPLGKLAKGPDIQAPIPVAEETPGNPPTLPRRPLKHLGTFLLRDAAPTKPNPIRSIVSFAFDAQGNVGVLRNDQLNSYSFVLASSTGQTLSETKLAIDAKHADNPKLAAGQPGKWIIVSSALGIEAKASAWWFDSDRRQFTPIKNFDCPSVEQVAATPNGDFVVLASRHRKYTIEGELALFAPDGRNRWRLKQDYNGGRAALFGPEDITVTPKGMIAVLDGAVKLFGMDGKFVKIIDLEKAWGRKPHYLAEIVADKNAGTLLIKDFRGVPPVVRMNLDGNVVSQFQPKHSDGRTIDPVRGFRFDPHGRIWACDGDCLLRLRDDGVSDLSVGAAPNMESLGGIAAVTLDDQERLYAVDDRTGAVHVYDSGGRKLRICKPEPADIKGKLVRANICAQPDGNVLFTAGSSFPDGSTFIQYGADGRRLGTKELDLDSIREECYSLPQNNLLVVAFQNAFLLSSNGNVTATIWRSLDRKWLGAIRGASVAPDGQFALITGRDLWTDKPWLANIYAASGAPVRTVSFHPSFRDVCFTFTGNYLVTCKDGEICVFTAAGKPVLSFIPNVSQLGNPQNWMLFSAMAGRELWIVSPDSKAVSKFALPE